MVDATINMVLTFTSRELVVNHIQDSTGLTVVYLVTLLSVVFGLFRGLPLQMTDDE